MYATVFGLLLFSSCSTDDFQEHNEKLKFDKLNDIIFVKEIDGKACEAWILENTDLVKGNDFKLKLQQSSLRNRSKNMITLGVDQKSGLQERGTPCFDSYERKMNVNFAVLSVCTLETMGLGSLFCVGVYVYTAAEILEDLEACVNN